MTISGGFRVAEWPVWSTQFEVPTGRSWDMQSAKFDVCA